MTPEENAINLISEFLQLNRMTLEKSKQCAIIVVKNILSSHARRGSGIPPEVFKYYSKAIIEIENYNEQK